MGEVLDVSLVISFKYNYVEIKVGNEVDKVVLIELYK